MTLRRRVQRLEARSGNRLRVLFASEAEAALEARPKQRGEVIFVIPEDMRGV